jgi:glycosyltransferase involved in cell wall biosynthesis
MSFIQARPAPAVATMSRASSAARRRPTVSALMTTYAREKGEHLAQALESVFAQSVAPDQIVLVLDGPVGADQEEVIARYRDDARIASVDIVRMADNRGLAAALNAGLERCAGEWVMRMDSDDVCHPDRLLIQVERVLAEPEIDVVSSWTEEFADGEEGVRLKSSPVRHDAVVQALRWRNVIVHPSILMRAGMLRRVGAYRIDYPLLEDYDLWARMAMAGARFHVVPAVLVRMRAGLGQSARRGGWRYCMHDIRFRTFLARSGFLNLRQYAATTSLYVAFRLAGTVLRGRLYGLART